MTTTGSILLVDDEEKILKTLGRALRSEGHRVLERADGRQARTVLGEGGVDVLVVDNLMPGLTGLELIRDVVATVPEADRPQIVMMTAHATVADAIEAMKLGALDFLQKPFEIDHLLVTVSRAVEHQRLRTQHRYLLTERDEEFDHYGIVGRSRSMQDVIHRAERVAETRSTVLITGETGTGKELVARAIHDRSAQRQMPLIKVNCAAIPETLLESELFGHVRGAFTGANMNKKGRFVSQGHAAGRWEVDVWANDAAREALASRARAVPPGAIVVEEHFERSQDGSGANVGPIMVMQKMPAGYAEEHGNWRWVVVGSQGQLVRDGVIEQCAGCHDDAPMDGLFRIVDGT